MAKTYKLTDLLVKSLKPRNKAYVTSDGKGLNIKVYPNGRKQWILRKSSGGKAHYIYLGTYPELSIKDARALAASQAAALQSQTSIVVCSTWHLSTTVLSTTSRH